MTIHRESGRRSGWVYLYRFAAGHHMSGKRHTNYTFRHRATRDLTDHGHASRWAHLPGYRRALWRMGALTVTLAIVYGMVTAETATVDSCMGALSALAVAGVLRARYLAASARHHKRIVRPLYETMTMITGPTSVHGHSHGDNHRRYLTIPRDYKHPKAVIRLTVPITWEARSPDIKRLNDLITRKLGGEWDSVTQLTAFPPRIDFIPSPAPPGSLTFAEFRSVLESGNANKLIIGMGTHGKVVDIDLDSDAPHIALSMGTGGGKSATMRLIVAYLIRHGVERVDIIDPKRISHDWAKGIPGVYIHRTMAQQMSAVSEFRKRMESRYDALEKDSSREFPRHVMVIEEQNSWMGAAKTYWDDYRSEMDSAERGRTPRANPAISDIAFCLFQGRQARMNIFSIFQSMSASAAGGRDMRENYGAKILARYSPQTWKMLVGTSPAPRSSRISGRARYALGDLDAQVQLAFITDAEAFDYAMTGAHAVGPSRDPLVQVDAAGAGSDDVPAMTLREMCDAGMIPMRYSAAKRARTRAGDDFPPGSDSPVGTLYAPRDVLAWHGGRKSRAPVN